MQLKKNMQVELDVESFGAQGEGIARVDGMPVFIPYALPEERILAHIVKTDKRYAFGKVLKILKASPDRREPHCFCYHQCGGCTCQHMSYEAQLAFKRAQVESCMRHIAGLNVPVAPALGMDAPWHYRNKISMPVSGDKNDPLIGYYAQRSHRVIPVESCLLSHEANDRLCAAVREWMVREGITPYCEENHSGLIRHIVSRVNRKGQLMALLVLNGRDIPHSQELLALLQKWVPEMVSLCISPNLKRGNVILGDSYRTIWGEARLEDMLCGNRFMLSPLSFFQVNPVQTEKLYRTAIDFAGLQPDELLADVYCGAGTITLSMARRCRKAIGIEIVPAAVENARRNAAANGIQNVEFHAGKAEELLPRFVADGLRPDVIVIDPPRKGVEPPVIRAIAEAGPSRVVYVSCNPATLARDAKLLEEAGFRVQKVQPVDMFCWTSGIETVCLLSKKNAKPKDYVEISVDAEDYYRIKSSEKDI